MNANAEQPKETRLESWKEIEVYLKRDFRTLRRWEREEGLPVHRHSHKSRTSVYAYPSEIDAWRASRKVVPEPVPLWRRLLDPPRALAFATTVVLCLMMAGSGIRPHVASAQDSGISTRQVWTGPEVNPYGGAASPDGRFLTYTDFGPPALAIRDLVTGETRPLMNGSWAEPVFQPYQSEFSPDGRLVISTWFKYKGTGGQYDLRVFPVDAGRASDAPRVVYSSSDEVPGLYLGGVSPDGKSILARLYRKDRTPQIALISIADGSVKVLKSLGWRGPDLQRLRFSADGRYIAYDLRPDANTGSDIFLLAADGSREVPLIQHPADDLLLGWAPDGRHILFGSDRTGTWDAWLVEVETGRPKGEPQLVKRNIGRIAPMGFARNGSFYYGLSAGVQDIYVATLDPTGGKVLEQPQLASQLFLGSNRGPSWSLDGESIAYFTGPDSHLFLRNLKTGQERALRTDLRPATYVRPRWSPDGQWLLVNSRDVRGGFGLHRVNAQTGAMTPVVPDASSGVWTQDGKSVIYKPNENGRVIRVRNLDAGQDSELYRADEAFSVRDLALSRDGRRLAFLLYTSTTAVSVMVMPSEGGTPRQLWRSAAGWGGLEWAADGTHLLFPKFGKMWRISAEGGEPELVVGLNPSSAEGFSMHPDGRRIAFVTGEPKNEVWVMDNFLPKAAAGR